MHINLTKMGGRHAQDLHRLKPDGIPALEVRSRQELTSLTKKLSSINFAKKVFVLSSAVSLGILTTPEGRPHAQQ